MSVQPNTAVPETPGPETDVVVRLSRTHPTIGTLLRHAREEKKISREKVAHDLCFRQGLLAAIEEDDFNALPAMVYAVGFVRSYAEYLGLNSEEIVRLLQKQLGAAPSTPQLSFPATPAEERLPSKKLIIACLLAVFALYGLWAAMSGSPPEETSAEANVASFAPQSTTPETPAAPAAEAAMPPTTTDQTPAADASAPMAAPADPALTAAAPVLTPEQQAAEIAKREQAAQQAAATRARVYLKADADAWVEITDKATGKILISRVMRPGEVYGVPMNVENPVLRTGNAGGLQVAVDGQILGILGDQGQVLNGQSLKPEALKALY
ncbi:MAG: helix-turn-helix domain-containing protein [Dongiaceae bacterium]